MGPCFWWGPACFLPAIMIIVMLVGLAVCLYFIFRRGGFCCPRHGWDNSSAPVSEIRKTCCAEGEITKQKERNNRE